MRNAILKSAACAVAVLGLTSWVSAGPIYGFYNITNNTAADAATAGQFSVEVIDAGSYQVDFKFRNAGPLASSITDIYFDDGTLLGIAQIFNGGPGVSFSQGAAPPDLPGGNTLTPAFDTTSGFLADSNSPAQPNGVNPGEWVTIRFDLQDTPVQKNYADTLAALANGEDLRIGIHVQGYAGGGSEAFVNTTAVVPLPAAAWMGMSLLGGVGGVGFFRRRQQRLLA